jgi:DNA-binding protein HU-beta
MVYLNNLERIIGLMFTKAILAKQLKKQELSSSHLNGILCIDALFETISDALSKGRRIELRGFGTFFVKKSAARKTAINGNMLIPEHGKVVFIPCEALRRAVWDCKFK